MGEASPVLDVARLRPWLQARLPAVAESLTAERLIGGQSNPSWLLRSGDDVWVLRAKPAPAAQLLPSAHAIEREYRVQAALADTEVPVPGMHVLCEDESVLGVAFYVMDFVEGRIFRDGWAPGLDVDERTEVFRRLLHVIATLHTVDVRAVGLEDFGRRGDYFDRLFSRWTRQYRASQTHEILAMDALIEWLPAHVPPGADEVTLVHGDYRLENLVLAPDDLQVRAVLDWELSTLGHPLVDLAYTFLAWHLPTGRISGFADLDYRSLGIPSEVDLLQAYCRRTGRDDVERVLRTWPFYLACNCFRLSAILQGIARRVEDGIASGRGAEETGRLAGPVAEVGWHIARTYGSSSRP